MVNGLIGENGPNVVRHVTEELTQDAGYATHPYHHWVVIHAEANRYKREAVILLLAQVLKTCIKNLKHYITTIQFSCS